MVVFPDEEGQKPTPADNLDALLADLPRGQRADHVGLPSNAHFEHPRNLLATESLQFEPCENLASKSFLGVLGGRVTQGPRLKDGRTNRFVVGGTPIGIGDDCPCLTIGRSRGGKGRSVLIPELLLLPRETSVLSLDPKGSNARITARYRAEVLGQRVAVLDSFGCGGSGLEKYHAVFNPIDILLRSDWRTFVPNCRLIADALIADTGSREPHWDETARLFVSSLCGHVATHVNYDGRRDLITLFELLSEAAAIDPYHPQRYWLEHEMLANDAAGGMIRAGARAFYDRQGGEFSSVLSNARKHLDFLSYECMTSVLRGPSIDLRDLKRSFMTLYVILPALRMEPLRGWLRLVVQMALAAFEEEPTLAGNPSVFQLDEFGMLGRLSAAERAIAHISGLGAKLHIAIQNLSQLKCYGDNYETFFANAGIVRVLGSGDDSTLAYVSKRLGDALALTRSSNAPSFDQAAQQGATGASWSLATHPLLTAEEIGRYVSRDDKLQRQLILRPGFRPYFVQRAYYDKHELFRGRFEE